MNKFLIITKINLLSFFNLQKVNNSKYKSVNKKNYMRLLILIIAFLYLSYYVYYLSSNLLPGLITLNAPELLFGILFLIVSVFVITSNLLRIKGVLFDFKDYDLLFSLPIKRNTILLSKITSLYILNLIYTMLFMIPGLLAYIKVLPFSNILLYFLLLFIIPIVPMIISIIMGVFMSLLTSKFINKTVGSYVINILIIAVSFFISFKLNDMNSLDMANGGLNLVSNIGGFYPIVNIFLRIITNFQIVDLFIFLIIPVILLMIMLLVLNRLYDRIRNNLIKSYTNDNYKIKKYENNKPMVSLYKKEMKRFFSNPMYPLNTIFGCLLLIFLVFGILIFNDNTIAKLLNVEELGEFLSKSILLVICILCAISSTTHCSISLEGKSLWIIKMIPLETIKILMSKILVNLTFLVPTIIFTSTFFGIYLQLDLIDFLLLYLMPLSYAIYTSNIGLLFNLMYPKFDYTNEVQVIKQTLPVFLTMIIGIISVILPLSIRELTTNYCLIITLVVFAVDILLFIIIDTYGIKKLNRL